MMRAGSGILTYLIIFKKQKNFQSCMAGCFHLYYKVLRKKKDSNNNFQQMHII